MKITEKELIAKLKELGQIKPGKDWVILTKSRILGQESFERYPVSILSIFRFLFQPRLAFASSVLAFALIGLFGFAQNSLPGDLLYPIKKTVERSQAIFVSEAEKPQASLETADKRLEELTKIAEANQVKKLAPALSEFQMSVSEATKRLSKMAATSSDPVAIKKVVDKTKKLEGKVQEVRSLGVAMGEEELSELEEVSNKLEVKSLVLDLEKRTLTKEQEEVLSKMKELVKEERYSEALIIFNTKFNQPAAPEPAEETEGLEE